MNRRGFLSLLAPAAALIVAPELLLPKRTFFLPPAGGWDGGLTVAALRHAKAILAAEDLINPLVIFEYDLMAFGSATYKIKAGSVHWAPTVRHVLLDEFTLDP